MSNPNDPVQQMIAEDIKKNPILMYIKGEKGMPMCGFSAAVMNIFEHMGVNYATRNVLADPNVREGIKRFTNWPTIPQVFINGQFVGGCDIVREMYEKGELQKLVQTAGK